MHTAEGILREVRTFAKTYLWLSPLNIKAEKNKFFQNRTYNPQFIYYDLPILLIKHYKKLLKRIPKKAEVNLRTKVFNNKIKETKLRLRLIESIGNSSRITLTSEKLYLLKFNKRYIEKAKKDAAIALTFGNQENLSAKEIYIAIKAYMAGLDIRKWKIFITGERDFYVQVKSEKKLIRISRFINCSFATLDSILAHEIDGHVIRAINAKKQKGVLKHRFPFYIKTEEGLASYLGDYCAEGGALSLKHHAVKYLGGYIALSNSFRETYNFFLDYGFTPDLAFQRTLRLKRGLTDTARPGVNAREAMYYEGMLEVMDYLGKGGDIKKLLSGKFGIKDLEHTSPSGNIILPSRVKDL